MSGSELLAPGFTESPYWWEEAPPVEAPPAPVPDRVDVAVVGGGYCGLTAALELAREGFQAVVLEAGVLGRAASSLNGGLVSGGLKLVPEDLARRFGAERAAALVEETGRAWPFLEDLLAREGIACHYRRTGRFIGAHSPAAHRAQARRAESLQALTGHPVTVVPRERQREEIDTGYYFGGLVVEGSGGLHPALYHQGLAAAARRAGVRIVEGTPVTGVARPSGGGLVLRTPRGAVAAREAVVATNGYTGPLTPWLRRRLIPLGSYMIATEPLPLETTRRLIPRGRMIVDTKRVLSYYRLSPDGRRILFGGRVSFRSATARQVAPRVHGLMTRVWPELARVRITHAWTGNVAFTFDHVPHLGTHDGVHYAAGCQGSGVAMMTYLGHQLARKLAGKASRPSAFDGLPFPTRPLYSGRPWFLPVVGTAYRVADWLDRRRAGGSAG